METFNRLPWMAKDSVFHRLAEIAEVSAMTKEERQKYDYALRKYRDNLCVYEGAIQKGIEKGIAKGMEQGIAKGMKQGIAKGMKQGIAKGVTKRNVEIVRRMKAKGYPLEEIMDCTGLSADEIGALS